MKKDPLNANGIPDDIRMKGKQKFIFTKLSQLTLPDFVDLTTLNSEEITSHLLALKNSLKKLKAQYLEIVSDKTIDTTELGTVINDLCHAMDTFDQEIELHLNSMVFSANHPDIYKHKLILNQQMKNLQQIDLQIKKLLTAEDSNKNNFSEIVQDVATPIAPILSEECLAQTHDALTFPKLSKDIKLTLLSFLTSREKLITCKVSKELRALSFLSYLADLDLKSKKTQFHFLANLCIKLQKKYSKVSQLDQKDFVLIEGLEFYSNRPSIGLETRALALANLAGLYLVYLKSELPHKDQKLQDFKTCVNKLKYSLALLEKLKNSNLAYALAAFVKTIAGDWPGFIRLKSRYMHVQISEDDHSFNPPIINKNRYYKKRIRNAKFFSSILCSEEELGLFSLILPLGPFTTPLILANAIVNIEIIHKQLTVNQVAKILPILMRLLKDENWRTKLSAIEGIKAIARKVSNEEAAILYSKLLDIVFRDDCNYYQLHDSIAKIIGIIWSKLPYDCQAFQFEKLYEKFNSEEQNILTYEDNDPINVPLIASYILRKLVRNLSDKQIQKILPILLFRSEKLNDDLQSISLKIMAGMKDKLDKDQKRKFLELLVSLVKQQGNAIYYADVLSDVLEIFQNSLTQLQITEIFSFIVEFLKDPDWRRAYAATKLLFGIKFNLNENQISEILPFLMKIMDGEEAAARWNATMILKNLADQDKLNKKHGLIMLPIFLKLVEYDEEKKKLVLKLLKAIGKNLPPRQISNVIEILNELAQYSDLKTKNLINEALTIFNENIHDILPHPCDLVLDNSNSLLQQLIMIGGKSDLELAAKISLAKETIEAYCQSAPNLQVLFDLKKEFEDAFRSEGLSYLAKPDSVFFKMTSLSIFAYKYKREGVLSDTYSCSNAWLQCLNIFKSYIQTFRIKEMIHNSNQQKTYT